MSRRRGALAIGVLVAVVLLAGCVPAPASVLLPTPDAEVRACSVWPAESANALTEATAIVWEVPRSCAEVPEARAACRVVMDRSPAAPGERDGSGRVLRWRATYYPTDCPSPLVRSWCSVGPTGPITEANAIVWEVPGSCAEVPEASLSCVWVRVYSETTSPVEVHRSSSAWRTPCPEPGEEV